MGKKGPCCHCGIKRTPLWRSGPPEKPVLCNACGSRWRTKGTLENYTPTHAQNFQPPDTKDSHNAQDCRVPSNAKKKDSYMKPHNVGDMERPEKVAGYDLYPTGFEDDTSNRSSSVSAISCSESCVQLGNMNGNEISGSVQFNSSDSYIPSKKRSRSPSSVEKLRRDLVDILREQEPSSLTAFSEEVLIYRKDDRRFSDEIGLGGVILKPSVSFTREESEASSLVIENNASYLNNVRDESLSLQSQSSELRTSQESNRMIQETGDAEEWEVNVANQSALRNKYLGNTLLRNPDILQNTNSPHMQISGKSQNVESSTPKNEMPETTPCSSRLIEGGTSLPAKRNLDVPYLPISGGPSS